MQQEVIFAGFGGQGVMLIGQLLANAAMMGGKEACWMPSYGPEMRGGTANCTVVVSESPIGSPVVPNPSAAVVMNRPSMDKFEPMVRKGGLLVVNSSLIHRKAERDDLEVFYLEANRLAEEEIGFVKTANMLALGAYIALSKAAEPDLVKGAMATKMKGKERFLDYNRAAFDRAYGMAQGEG